MPCWPGTSSSPQLAANGGEPDPSLEVVEALTREGESIERHNRRDRLLCLSQQAERVVGLAEHAPDTGLHVRIAGVLPR